MKHLLDGYNLNRKSGNSKKEERKHPELKAEMEEESASVSLIRQLHPE